MAAHAEWLHTAASVQLLTYSRCQEFSSSGVRFTHQPAAAVSSLSPTRGAAEGGTPVTRARERLLGWGGGGGGRAAVPLGRVGDARGVRERVGARVQLGGRPARAAGYVALELSTDGREHTSDGVHLELVELVVLAFAP
jgi:hypothetical protein